MVAASVTSWRRPSQAWVGFHPSPLASIRRKGIEGQRLSDGTDQGSAVNRVAGEQRRGVPEH